MADTFRATVDNLEKKFLDQQRKRRSKSKQVSEDELRSSQGLSEKNFSKVTASFERKHSTKSERKGDLGFSFGAPYEMSESRKRCLTRDCC